MIKFQEFKYFHKKINKSNINKIHYIKNKEGFYLFLIIGIFNSIGKF